MNEIPYTEDQFDAVLLPQTSDSPMQWRQAMTQDGVAPEHLNVLSDDKTTVRIYDRVGTGSNSPVTYRSSGITMHLTQDESDPDIHIPIQTT